MTLKLVHKIRETVKHIVIVIILFQQGGSLSINTDINFMVK